MDAAWNPPDPDCWKDEPGRRRLSYPLLRQYVAEAVRFTRQAALEQLRARVVAEIPDHGFIVEMIDRERGRIATDPLDAFLPDGL